MRKKHGAGRNGIAQADRRGAQKTGGWEGCGEDQAGASSPATHWECDQRWSAQKATGSSSGTQGVDSERTSGKGKIATQTGTRLVGEEQDTNIAGPLKAEKTPEQKRSTHMKTVMRIEKDATTTFCSSAYSVKLGGDLRKTKRGKADTGEDSNLYGVDSA